jgi:2-haloacid dehalogenase/putative hydrolase of the HAD superfamily
MDHLQGIFLDFYGTVAAGDLQAVEKVCRMVIDAHHLSKTAPELAWLWGQKYFQAIERYNGAEFKTLAAIEEETLIETIFPLTAALDVGSYIRVLDDYLVRPGIYDEVRQVLDQLHLPVCVVSNADENALLAAIEHLGLKFEYVVSSEQARSYKPHSGIFEHALELTGWSPRRVLHVGDSLHSDVGGAQSLGIRAAWVNRTERISDIGDAHPDWTWEDLRPLLNVQHH